MKIDRRRFLGIAAFSSMALALNGKGFGSFCGRDSEIRFDARLFRATVVRCDCHLDLQSAYLDDPETGPCQNFSVGQIFEFRANGTIESVACPRAVAALADCCRRMRGQSLALVNCGSGTRPVIFKVEVVG